MIRNTHARIPQGVLSAYRDNAAVIEGSIGHALLSPIRDSGIYRASDEPIDILMKVETHNHPTAISPFPGAATGSGGEIRDEGATGRGAKPKAGLTGFSVSNLRIPGYERPWERDVRRAGAHRLRARDHDRGPDRRRLLQQRVRPPGDLRLLPHLRAAAARAIRPRRVRGYHKPIMIAGGLGNVRRAHVEKAEVPVGREARRARRPGHADRPGRRRGLLGRQRHLERRSGLRLGAARQPGDPAPRAGGDRSLLGARRSAIRSLLIHDVGAGGLSNAVPEAVAHSARGARVDLRGDPERRARHVAAGDVVQRGAGALRAGVARGSAARVRARSPRASAARSP